LIVAELYNNDGRVVSQEQRGTLVANKVHTHEYLILSAVYCLAAACCLPGVCYPMSCLFHNDMVAVSHELSKILTGNMAPS
jgi:hypothetical protein